MQPFYHYNHKELVAFKFFFWIKSFLFSDHLNGAKFSITDNLFDQYEEIIRKIFKTYNKCPTTEIWNEEGFNTTLRQIECITKWELQVIQRILFSSTIVSEK